MCGPGKTIFEPVRAAEKGMPQALAWNIGTTGVTMSFWEKLSMSGMQLVSECSIIPRWE